MVHCVYSFLALNNGSTFLMLKLQMLVQIYILHIESQMVLLYVLLVYITESEKKQRKCRYQFMRRSDDKECHIIVRARSD